MFATGNKLSFYNDKKHAKTGHSLVLSLTILIHALSVIVFDLTGLDENGFITAKGVLMMKGKLGILVTVLVLSMALVSPVFATLGPIHVELNMIKPRLSAARANQITAFKVYIRYNVNIKIHDWFKFWFPIDEFVTSDNPKDVVDQICDGLPKIDENINNPRFVPNDDFFKKYPNSKLAGLKQVYEIKDERTNIDFFDYANNPDIPDWGWIRQNKDNKRPIRTRMLDARNSLSVNANRKKC